MLFVRVALDVERESSLLSGCFEEASEGEKPRKTKRG